MQGAICRKAKRIDAETRPFGRLSKARRIAEIEIAAKGRRHGMRNIERWRPTKFVMHPNGRIGVASARRDLAAGSVLIASLVARWYAKNLPKYVHGHLLDLGCGKVPLYGLYAPYADEVLCTDWPSSLHGDLFIDFASDLNVGIPLPDRSADTVVLSDVLEHIYQPSLLLAEIRRVLRPGGVLLLNTPFLYWVHEAPNDFFRYTQYAIRRMAAEAQFDIECVEPIGGGLLVIADHFGKGVQSMSPIGPKLSAWVQKLALLAKPDLPRSDIFPLVIGAVLRAPPYDRHKSA
jgi:SAM-dependent methyltransferase